MLHAAGFAIRLKHGGDIREGRVDAAVEDESVGKCAAADDQGRLDGVEIGIRQYPVIRAGATGIGVCVVRLVRRPWGSGHEHRGERGDTAFGAGVGIEVAADHEIIPVWDIGGDVAEEEVRLAAAV